MKIAVFGSGGVGGTFGARLAQQGHEIHFIARGAHLAAMRASGLRVEGVRGDLHLHPVRAVEDPAEIGPVDFVLFCVKLWDTEAAAPRCRALLGPDTAVLTLQNGVDGPDILSRALGPAHVMAGAAGIFATIAAPGLIRQPAPVQNIMFGELDGRISARGRAFEAAMTAAGIDGRFTGETQTELWKKFVYLSALSGMTCYTRGPVGPIRDDARLFAMLRAAIAEAIAVGRAKGVRFDDGVLDERLGVAGRLAPEMKTSMLYDLESGNRLELPWLSGAVVRMGRALGVPTPTHEAIVAALEPVAKGKSRA